MDVSYFGSERRENKIIIAEFVDGNIEYRGILLELSS